MKKVSEIYSDYNIYNGLQSHLLRVSAVAKIICDNTDQDVESDHIISACLLHDMGNIIKAKLDMFPELLEPEGLGHWTNIQNDFFDKYGRDEHHATMEIGREIGVSQKTLDYMNLIGFTNVGKAETLGNKICSYSDMRVAPNGIVPLKDRLEDLKERYKKRGIYDPVETERIHNKLYEFEEEIFSNLSIEKEAVNNQSGAPIIKDLKSYIIV